MAMLGGAPVSEEPHSIVPVAISPGTPTELRYALDRSDVFRSRLRTALHNPVLRAIYALLLVWNLYRAFQGEGSIAVKAVSALISVVFVVGVMVVAQVVVMAAMSYLFANRGVLGRHVLTMTDAGLTEKTEFSESTHMWPGMSRVLFTGDFMYVYVTEMHYHPIPLSAFASRDAAHAYAEEIRRRIREAKGDGAARQR